MTKPSKEKTNVYIDGNNLYQSIWLNLGWKMDYQKFYTFLKHKYHFQNAYLFIGYVEKNKRLYNKLEQIGFTLVFKETIPVYNEANNKHEIKGNCDADMVLHIVRDYYENKIQGVHCKAVVVTADGDFASTIKFLRDRDALEIVLAPCGEKHLSILIRKLNIKINYLSYYKHRLEYPFKKEKPPIETKHL